MQKNSGQSDNSILRKRLKCGENWPFWAILGHFGRFLQTWWMCGPETLCILSGIFWYKFRVPTWCTLVRFKNRHFFCPMASRVKQWQFSSIVKIPHVGTLNLYQKMPDKMQKDSGQSDHSILRKRPKCGENWQFWAILDVISRLDDCIDLNPFAPCQASSGTSLEYPHGILKWNLKIAFFLPYGL